MKRASALCLLCLLLAGCRQPDLLEGLDQQQVNEVVSLLQRNNIAAGKQGGEKAGYRVTVRQVDFAAAVDLLNLYGLPSRPRVEVAQMFPADSLVASPRAEKARLFSALEQRLEQSLRQLQGVVSGRVHVSYDIDAGEGGRQIAPVHLSALVVHEGDVEPQLLISDIKRFLKNSFAGVEYEHISVVLSPRSAIQHASPSLESMNDTPGWLWPLVVVSLTMVLGMVALFGYRYQVRQEKG